MWIFQTVTKLLREDTLPCPLHGCLPKGPAAWPTEPTEGINTCHQKRLQRQNLDGTNLTMKIGKTTVWQQSYWYQYCEISKKKWVNICWNQSQILSKIKITKINQTSSKSSKVKWTQLTIKIHANPSKINQMMFLDSNQLLELSQFMSLECGCLDFDSKILLARSQIPTESCSKLY